MYPIFIIIAIVCILKCLLDGIIKLSDNIEKTAAVNNNYLKLKQQKLFIPKKHNPNLKNDWILRYNNGEIKKCYRFWYNEDAQNKLKELENKYKNIPYSGFIFEYEIFTADAKQNFPTTITY